MSEEQLGLFGDAPPARRKPREIRECAWPCCLVTVPAAMLMCKSHWYRVPISLRRRIWTTYRAGQEIDGEPSDAYWAAYRDVQRWIKQHGGPV
jgi:hypothetical protein